MKTKILLSVMTLALMIGAMGQEPAIELTFMAENNGQDVPLDSILVENLTQGGDTMLCAPDTVLVLGNITSISDNEAIAENSFSVSQNYPNPFNGKTIVNLYLPEKEHIKITVRDILGRELAQYKNTLNSGSHSFAFYSGSERYYLFTVTGKQKRKTIKMLNANTNTTNRKCNIVYNGYEDNLMGFKSQKAINEFVFDPGDELRYTGYAKTVNEVNGSDVIEDAPQIDSLYMFIIAEGIPCPGIPMVNYEGQDYNTVYIGSQCWLKENLNIGTRIDGENDMQDNGIIEKYCYDNIEDSCDVFGGLYQWKEMMQYVTTEGAQGICPDGWHIPTDEDWKQLEGEIDSQYSYPDPEWDNTEWRGHNVGTRIKSTSGWFNYSGVPGPGTDLFGFTCLAGGEFYHPTSNFTAIHWYTSLWSSSGLGDISAWQRMPMSGNGKIHRMAHSQLHGFYVRCLKDDN